MGLARTVYWILLGAPVPLALAALAWLPVRRWFVAATCMGWAAVIIWRFELRGILACSYDSSLYGLWRLGLMLLAGGLILATAMHLLFFGQANFPRWSVGPTLAVALGASGFAAWTTQGIAVGMAFGCM
jgi:hypothetical protein